MADKLRKLSTIASSIFYFLIFLQFASNVAKSQNLFTNAESEQRIAAPLGNVQLNNTDQFRNEFQEHHKDQMRSEFQAQYEQQSPDLPNESSKLNKHNVHFETQPLHTYDEQNPVQIPKVIQLLNNDQLPNNEQILTKFLLWVTHFFPRLTANSISSELKDVIKSLETSSFNNQNGLNNFTLISNSNISSECLISLQDFEIGIEERRVWAIRMLDSFGKIPNGILDGSRLSFGDFDMCINTELPGKYQGMYCMIKIKRYQTSERVPLQPVNWSSLFNRDFSKFMHDNESTETLTDVPVTTSICLPSNCSKTELKNILREVNSFIDQPMDIKVRQCYTREEIQWNNVQIYILFVMTILFLFEAFATILDIRLRHFHGDEFDKVELSKTVRCTLAFSFYSNTVLLFKKTDTSNSLKILHGVRVISQIWIIITHTILINLLTVGRFYQVLLHWTKLFFQIIQNGFLGTETFFFIGGFLLMNSFMKANKISFSSYALVRFIRLMPPVLFTIGCLFLSENISSGPMWKLFTNFLIRPCKTNLWRNLLFLNNMDDIEDCCLLWTWYISADMQLYLISYLILILIKKNPKLAVMVLKIIVVTNVVGLFIFYVIYQFPPHPMIIYAHFLDSAYNVKMTHFGTYNHLTPYFLGMLTGYVIATDKKITLTRFREFLMWFTAVVFAIACLFTTYIWNHKAHPATVIESALYGSTHRLLWSLMLSWVVYACINGKAGIVTSILSWDGFAPFGRLTYMVYLIHPLLELLFIGQMKFVLLADFKFVVLLSLGFLVVSYIAAFVACLFCELPFIRLSSILFSSKSEKIKTK